MNRAIDWTKIILAVIALVGPVVQETRVRSKSDTLARAWEWKELMCPEASEEHAAARGCGGFCTNDLDCTPDCRCWQWTCR